MEDEKKSTHRAEVVAVKLEPHGNADSLSIVRVYGYQVVVRTADWKDGDLAAYIVPDSFVPDAPEYAYLNPKGALRDTDRRIRVRRFRGQMSQGLLVKAPVGSKAGDDVSDILGITRYEPGEPGTGSGSNLGKVRTYMSPKCFVPKYDVENWYRYGALTFKDGEQVIISEKLHGCNARYVYSSRDCEFFAGSRSQWIARTSVVPEKTRWRRLLRFLRIIPPMLKTNDSVWWRIIEQHPEIEQWCCDHPDTALFGEIYGDVQDLKYGHEKGCVSFAAFNTYKAGTYGFEWDHCSGIPEAPIVYRGVYSDAVVRSHIDGPTLIYDADHCREGIVIHTLDGRHLKAVSDIYLERAK